MAVFGQRAPTKVEKGLGLRVWRRVDAGANVYNSFNVLFIARRSDAAVVFGGHLFMVAPGRLW